MRALLTVLVTKARSMKPKYNRKRLKQLNEEFAKKMRKQPAFVQTEEGRNCFAIEYKQLKRVCQIMELSFII